MPRTWVHSVGRARDREPNGRVCGAPRAGRIDSSAVLVESRSQGMGFQVPEQTGPNAKPRRRFVWLVRPPLRNGAAQLLNDRSRTATSVRTTTIASNDETSINAQRKKGGWQRAFVHSRLFFKSAGSDCLSAKEEDRGFLIATRPLIVLGSCLSALTGRHQTSAPELRESSTRNNAAKATRCYAASCSANRGAWSFPNHTDSSVQRGGTRTLSPSPTC